MHSLRLALASLTLPLFVACGGGGPDLGSPDGTFKASYAALQSNDLAGLMEVVATPADLQGMRSDWDAQRSKPMSAAEKMQFNGTLAMLTAPNADKQLFDMVAPQLEDLSDQWSMMLGMASMAASGLTGENAGAQEATTALLGKLESIDITDEAKIKRAISILTKTAKALDVKDATALQAMTFDQLLGKGGVALGGVKEILKVYGLDLDATLSSIDVKVAGQTGNKAQLEVAYSLFGAPKTTTVVEMIQTDGRWAPKK